MRATLGTHGLAEAGHGVVDDRAHALGGAIPWPQAGAYRVEVMNPGFQILATFDTGSDPSLVLGPEDLGSLRQMSGLLVWRVSARVGSDFLASSAPEELPILQ